MVFILLGPYKVLFIHPMVFNLPNIDRIRPNITLNIFRSDKLYKNLSKNIVKPRLF